MSVQTIDEHTLKAKIKLNDQSYRAVEDAFIALTNDQATMPPIMRIDIPEHNGEIDIKSAYIKGWDNCAVKLSSGFFDNPSKGLPSGSGLMVVIATDTGIPRAVLLDNGYLTDVRTGLAGAVAANHLAPKQVETVGIIGSGKQARFQLQALSLARNFSQVLVYSPNRQHSEQYAQTMSETMGCPVTATANAKTLVSQSDLVITTTPSTKAIIQPDWLHPKLHITAMGSDAPDKNEIAAEAFSQFDYVACDSLEQCLQMGELHHVQNANLLEQIKRPILTLGQLAQGQTARQSDNDITLCDLTGTGAQDTAIAQLALQLCKQ